MSEWYSKQSKANLAAHIVNLETQIAERDAALEAADALADECKRMALAIREAFNNGNAGFRYGIATSNAFHHRLSDYREARKN